MIETAAPAREAEATASGVNALSPGEALRGEVAVVIAAWRASATIGRAVASALAEPETAEIIVVDDASDDNGATIAAARAADDGAGRLTVIAADRNAGPAAARNAAIAASRAPWIAVLDSDDWIVPGRLSALLALAHEGYDFIADDLLQTPEGSPVSEGRPLDGKTLWFSGDRTPIDIPFSLFVQGNIPQASRPRGELGFLKPLMRRAFLERHGLSYDEGMRLGEDYDLYARALALGARMRLIPWTGYVSVLRGNSLSALHSRADLAALEAADDRLLASSGLKAAERRLVREHRFSTRSKIVWIDFMAALKSGKPVRALSIMLRDPRQAPYVMRGLWKIAMRRIAGGA